MIFIFLLCDNCLSFDRVQLLLVFRKKQERTHKSVIKTTHNSKTAKDTEKKVYIWANKYTKNSNSFINQ